MQRWSCASTPIHDPGDQSLLGVLDITGGDNIVGPHGSCDGGAPMCYPRKGVRDRAG